MSIEPTTHVEASSTDNTVKTNPSRRRACRPNVFFAVMFAALAILTVAFSLTSPLGAGPDETAHILRGVSLVHGQIVGTMPDGTSGETVVTVPRGYALDPTCYRFKSNQPASCQAPVPDPSASVEIATTAGLYNPLYYAVVSWPTLFAGPPESIYLMRFLSAVVCSLLLAAGLTLLRTINRGGFALMGALAAISPMVIFLNGVVNPEGMEISAAFACAVGAFTILRHPNRRLLPMRMLITGVAAACLVLSRGLSPLFLAIIIIIAFVTAQRGAVRTAFTWRGTWLWTGFILLATLAAVGWTFATNSLVLGATSSQPESPRNILLYTLGKTSYYLQSMIGIFGWLDVTLPGWVIMAWSALVGVAVLAALALGSWRDRAGVFLAGGTVLALPIAAGVVQWDTLGPFWQGRYALPIGIPMLVLAGMIASDRGSEGMHDFGRRLMPWLCLVAGACLMTASVINLHRYVAGADGWWLSIPPGAWLPPIPILVVLSAFAIGSTGYLALLWYGSRITPPNVMIEGPHLLPSSKHLAVDY